MACELASGIGIAACKNALGGIKTLWIGNYADFKTGVTVNDTTEMISALPEATIFKFDLTRATGQAVETPTPVGDANEGILVDQKISVQFSNLTAAKRKIVNTMMKGRLVAFIETSTGEILMYGRNEGLDCSGGAIDTGKAKSDFNGYKLEFTAQEPVPAFHLQAYTTDPFDNYPDITVSGTQAAA